VIAHAFPPVAGSGSNRALAVTRYLPLYGWRPIVLTLDAAWAAPRDDGLLALVPAGTRVVRTASLEPRPRPRPSATAAAAHATGTTAGANAVVSEPAVSDRAASEPAGAGVTGQAAAAAEIPGAETHRMETHGAEAQAAETAALAPTETATVAPAQTTLWRARRIHTLGRGLRGHLGHLKRFPDAHLGWLPFAVIAGSQLDVDLIYSSSGPFSSHLVGLVLSRLLRRPWVAELRDGWYRWNRAIFPDYPAWRDGLERCLEGVVMRSADRVVLVTERMADAFRGQYADSLPAEHFAVVSNGFDPALISTAANVDESQPGAFEVVHTGALYYGRSIASFLAAAASLVEQDADFAAAFRLTLVGTLDATARAELGRSRVGDHTQLVGQIDHAATVARLRRAALLLLVANTTPGAEATVPGKLFEYLAVGRPILAVAPMASSTADVLARTGGGYLAAGDDVAGIVRALRQAFAAHRTHAPCRPDPREVARYDRRRLTGELARLFDGVVAGAARRV
jgi:glycosyltransferase involved in cell wall biosynthesis